MTGRAHCDDCGRPLSHCVCALIPSLPSRTRLLILQHPDEARHPFNTARFAARGVTHARLIVGECFDANLWECAEQPSWLLFPGPQAVTPTALASMAGPRPIQLIVPDGTWRKVRGLLTANPSLARLPRVALAPGGPSGYRVRLAREPAARATIEAVTEVLNVLEAPADFSPLLRPFHAMVERQLAAQALNARPRR